MPDNSSTIPRPADNSQTTAKLQYLIETRAARLYVFDVEGQIIGRHDPVPDDAVVKLRAAPANVIEHYTERAKESLGL